MKIAQEVRDKSSVAVSPEDISVLKRIRLTWLTVVAAGKQSSRGLRKMIKQRAYGLPANFESGEGYEVDALNAYKPKEFAKLINSQIEPPYFDEDVHKQILEREEFQAETIDAKIREKIAFLNEDENG